MHLLSQSRPFFQIFLGNYNLKANAAAATKWNPFYAFCEWQMESLIAIEIEY